MVFTKDDMDAFQPKFTGLFAVFLPSALKSLAKYTLRPARWCTWMARMVSRITRMP